MAKSRALDKRRKSVKSIRKITRTMELVATAQFKRAMERAIAADAYTKRLVTLVHDIALHEWIENPLVVEAKYPPERKKAVLLTLSANRGMCGGFNAGIMRLATHRLQELQKDFGTVSLEVSGKRGISAFKFRGMKIDQSYTDLQDKPSLAAIKRLAEHFLNLFLAEKLFHEHKIDRLDVCYVKFESISKQYPVVETLLPVAELMPEGDVNAIDTDNNPEFKTMIMRKEEEEDVSAIRAGKNMDYKTVMMLKKADDAIADGKDLGAAHLKTGDGSTHFNNLFEYITSRHRVVDEAIPLAFKAKLFKCFLDSAVNEQIARMVAMKSATESADKMIGLLTTAYNRARQSQITNEILEIISGADALAN
jgi:F-type H+-transporting ATPase subunit gamma